MPGDAVPRGLGVRGLDRLNDLEMLRGVRDQPFFELVDLEEPRRGPQSRAERAP